VSENSITSTCENDECVQRQGKILDVVEIILEFDDRIVHSVAVLVIDLGPAGYSRFYAMPVTVKRDFLGQRGDEFGAFRGAAPRATFHRRARSAIAGVRPDADAGAICRQPYPGIVFPRPHRAGAASDRRTWSEICRG